MIPLAAGILALSHLTQAAEEVLGSLGGYGEPGQSPEQLARVVL